jgi:hypothetical protein
MRLWVRSFLVVVSLCAILGGAAVYFLDRSDRDYSEPISTPQAAAFAARYLDHYLASKGLSIHEYAQDPQPEFLPDGRTLRLRWRHKNDPKRCYQVEVDTRSAYRRIEEVCYG